MNAREKTGFPSCELKIDNIAVILRHLHFVSTIDGIMEAKLKRHMIAVIAFQIFMALKRAVLLILCYELMLEVPTVSYHTGEHAAA